MSVLTQQLLGLTRRIAQEFKTLRGELENKLSGDLIGLPSGVAPLDENGKVPTNYLPSSLGNDSGASALVWEELDAGGFYNGFVSGYAMDGTDKLAFAIDEAGYVWMRGVIHNSTSYGMMGELCMVPGKFKLRSAQGTGDIGIVMIPLFYDGINDGNAKHLSYRNYDTYTMISVMGGIAAGRHIVFSPTIIGRADSYTGGTQ